MVNTRRWLNVETLIDLASATCTQRNWKRPYLNGAQERERLHKFPLIETQSKEGLDYIFKNNQT